MKEITKRIQLVGVAILVIVLCPHLSEQNQYCAISAQHTLCKFRGVGPRCKTPIEIGIPRKDRDLIMELHNTFRSTVASGRERRGKPGPQPTAANMKEMVWDVELAATAQRLADQCKYTHDCLECRKVSRFLTGQNLYQFSENIRRPNANWTQALYAWYDEVQDWSPRHIKSFHFIKPLGHYTQILWADTDRIGCGYAYFNEGKWNRKLYICNYGPAGNIITTPMYTQGPPCSACPEGTSCSRKYPGLCTQSRSSAISFPSFSGFQPRKPFAPPTFPTRRPTTTTTTTTTTRRPSTKPPTPINEIVSNDINVDVRGNFRRKPSTGRFYYNTVKTTPNRGRYQERFSFVPTRPPTTTTTTRRPAYDPIRFSAFPSPRRRVTDTQATASVTKNPEAPVSRITDMNSILIYCDFDFAKCPIRFTGERWNYTGIDVANFGRGFGTTIPRGKTTNLFIRSLMSPKEDGKVCLSFRFLKMGSLPLRVTAGTFRQKPRIVEIREESRSPNDWLTASIQFENLRSDFLIIFQILRNNSPRTVRLAIDDILVTRGICK